MSTEDKKYDVTWIDGEPIYLPADRDKWPSKEEVYRKLGLPLDDSQEKSE